MILGLMTFVPVEKYQKSYIDTFKNIHSIPQKRVDHNYKYVEYIEEGGIPIPFETFHSNLSKAEEKIKRNFRCNKKEEDPRKRKPYFIRDEHNPRILYPYRRR